MWLLENFKLHVSSSFVASSYAIPASSGSWWWTGKPGMPQSMGSQRVGHDWVTELNWFPLWAPGEEVVVVLVFRVLRHSVNTCWMKECMNEGKNRSLNDIKEVGLRQDLLVAPIRKTLPFTFHGPPRLSMPLVSDAGVGRGGAGSLITVQPAGVAAWVPLSSNWTRSVTVAGTSGAREGEAGVGRGTWVRCGAGRSRLHPSPGPFPQAGLSGRGWASRQAGRSRGVCYRPPEPLQRSF